ncbi:MAG: tetratricopeptide repeat protein, partial [Gammaproteobacteria bacterium]
MKTKPFAVFVISFFFCPFASVAQTDAVEAARTLRAMYFQRDFEGAVAQGKDATAKFPQALDLRAWYLLSLARNDQAKEAVAAAEEMLSSAKESPWAHFALAGALNYLSSRGDEALAASEKVLALVPEHPDAIWLRAETLMRQKKHEEAVRFVDSQPPGLKNSAELLSIKASALYTWSQGPPRDESRLAAAYSAWEEARKIDPSNVSAQHLPGWNLLNSRRIPEAYPLLKKASELSPLSTSLRTTLWRAIMARTDITAESKNKEVESDMDSFLQRRGSYPGALSSVASYAREFKLPAMTKLAEERILERFPDSVEAEWVL